MKRAMPVAATRLLPVLLCVSVLLVAGSARAAEVHPHPGVSFGSPGSGNGEFSSPHGVAVNNATGAVYVADTENNRVEEFTADGSYVGEFDGAEAAAGKLLAPTAIAVDNSTSALDPSRGDVYVLDSGHGEIDKFDAAGKYLGQITGAETLAGSFVPGEGFRKSSSEEDYVEGLAVDASGNVWVTVFSGPVYEFSNGATNVLTGEVATAVNGAFEGLGVDSANNLYIHAGGGRVVKLNRLGETLSNPFSSDSKPGQVAVDRSLGEVYLDNFDAIEAFTTREERVEEFGRNDFTVSRGIAVDESDGTVYVSDTFSDTVTVFEAVYLPSVVVTPLSDQQPRSVTLNGKVDPEGRPVSSCVFEYGAAEEFASTETYEHSVPCSPASLGSGSNPVAVEAHIAGLSAETTYDYRLVAENEAAVPSVTTNEELFTGPRLEGEFVTDVAAGSATLNARLSANGGDTHFYFQYGRTAAFGSEAPSGAPGVAIGAGLGAETESVHLQGLEPGSEYHYRLVVEQGGEVFYEPEHVFETQSLGGSSGLVDNRMWELVSPANKQGVLFELFQSIGQVQAAEDGSGIAYMGKSGASSSISLNPEGKVVYEQDLSERVTGGWRSTDLTLPNRLLENGEPSLSINSTSAEYRLFSPNLNTVAVEPQTFGTPPLAPGVTERTLYLRDNDTGAFTPLVTGKNLEEPSLTGHNGGAAEFQMHFLAATPDLAHVVFSTPKALTPEAIDEENAQSFDGKGEVQRNLYETGEEGLKLVNVLPGHEGVAHGKYPVPGVLLAGVVGGGAGRGRGGAPRAVSDDGRRIAWTWGDPYSPESLDNYRGLYVRDMVEKKTLRVGGAAAAFQTMNSTGTRVFFLEDGELYAFNFESDKQYDLTAAHGAGEATAGVQETVADVSEDGSYVYFVATGVLAAGAAKGEDNLYLAHEVAGTWTITYVATLSASDRPDWHADSLFASPALPLTTSRVSPDGRYLAFMSQRSLTGYDNRDAVSDQPDEEVFLYDATANRLLCASCDPTGARPAGVFDTRGGVDNQRPSELLVDRVEAWVANNSGSDHWLAGNIPGWDEAYGLPSTYQPRYLGDDGRLFFDSPVGLVPQDTNGREDVYEFEPAGVGSCNSTTASQDQVYIGERDGHVVDGCVGLISSGTSSAESAFYDASVSGNDVFFTTTSKLVGDDVGESYDVYDAHVCSSTVPCRGLVATPPPCTSSDSCKAAPALQPEFFGPPPSATFNGTGNLKPSESAGVRKTTAAVKLARALKTCRKKRKHKAQARCKHRARQRYRAGTKRHARQKRRGSKR